MIYSAREKLETKTFAEISRIKLASIENSIRSICAHLSYWQDVSRFQNLSKRKMHAFIMLESCAIACKVRNVDKEGRRLNKKSPCLISV